MNFFVRRTGNGSRSIFSAWLDACLHLNLSLPRSPGRIHRQTQDQAAQHLRAYSDFVGDSVSSSPMSVMWAVLRVGEGAYKMTIRWWFASHF